MHASADLETIFATICAAHRAGGKGGFVVVLIILFSRLYTCEFSRRLIYKTLSLSRRCARLVGKTTAMPLAKGRCSIQRELVETLANENRSFVAKIILLLFQMLAREGLHGRQLSYIRTVDLFVSF
jgi:hypothetical protein